jgi:hypothetical protein
MGGIGSGLAVAMRSCMIIETRVERTADKGVGRRQLTVVGGRGVLAVLPTQ